MAVTKSTSTYQVWSQSYHWYKKVWFTNIQKININVYFNHRHCYKTRKSHTQARTHAHMCTHTHLYARQCWKKSIRKDTTGRKKEWFVTLKNIFGFIRIHTVDARQDSVCWHLCVKGLLKKLQLFVVFLLFFWAAPPPPIGAPLWSEYRRGRKNCDIALNTAIIYPSQ